MKKIIAILFFVFSIFSLASAQSLMPSGYRNFDQRATYLSGFDGDNPLSKDMMIEITEVSSNGIQEISDPRQAYKGETKKIFLRRIHMEDSIVIHKKLSIMDSLMKEVYAEDHSAKKEIKKSKTLSAAENLSVGAGIVFLLMFIFSIAKIISKRL